MSYLPRITALDVAGYEMYPGTSAAPGLHRSFDPGLTLVVGANGLGKTTLVTLIRHMCAGPARLSNRTGGTFDAGRLRTTPAEREVFADRVGDRASGAHARIQMQIGDKSIAAGRDLSNLSLVTLEVDGAAVDATEDEFQSVVVAASRVTGYEDWLLLVDHLVFVTEDRPQPFWDRNVQRQLLRVLLRDAASARALSDAESRHISADSEFRNARAQLGRHRQRFEALRLKVAGTGDVNDRLVMLTAERNDVDRRIADAERTLDEAHDRYREAIREQEVAELQLQLSVDHLEAARFELIESTLPAQDDVVRYLQARLLTDQACPACGQDGGEIDANASRCFVCGLPLQGETTASDIPLAELEERVERASTAIEPNRRRAVDRGDAVRGLEATLAAERSQRLDLDGRIKALRSQLPTGAADLGSTTALIADLEDDVATLGAELDQSRSHLQDLIDRSNDAVREHQDEIKRVFDTVATMFLVESCHLVPHQTLLRIGQEGERFEVQAFNLDLGSSTEPGESRRETREEVSESQRVFIDIAFRIALMHTCVEGRSSTMIIDAPEGSLDVVFASNAAMMLAAFVDPSVGENRLVVASNLVEGSLLPGLARLAGIRDHDDSRLIDLLEIAAPTTAVVLRGDDYRAVLAKALSSSAAAESES